MGVTKKLYQEEGKWDFTVCSVLQIKGTLVAPSLPHPSSWRAGLAEAPHCWSRQLALTGELCRWTCSLACARRHMLTCCGSW